MFNIELGSNLITVRGVVLNLTVICQKCNFELDKNWFAIGAILKIRHSINEN